MYRLNGLTSRVFAYGPGDLGSISGRVIPKTFKMVLDTSLLNTQLYKVRIEGKVEQSKERSTALPYTSVQQLLKRELSGHPQLRSPTLFFLLIYIYIYIYIQIDRQNDRQKEKVCLWMINIYVVPSISFQTFLYRHLKLSQTLGHSVCYCYISYEMTDQFYDLRFK